MEISGKIIAALEKRSGTSSRTGNAWASQSFVIETHEQYPKRCVFDVFGEDRLKEFNINVGDELTVSFDIDAHEYNGRWFNNLRAWRVQRDSEVPAPQAPDVPFGPAPETAQPIPAPTAGEDTADDLPF